ncbi:acyltransferase-domain-containing protein [Teratosphaeria nubilosa]|uniref:Acyltransferase-domain-containing protein n=1 Tax=Teratosphaeria nubilosa TaxID=161662 RepID=A0A6G1L2B9_9PEZI|nr:acyltransferase-domain-containing protein [Teratosphaeria nubilosa]
MSGIDTAGATQRKPAGQAEPREGGRPVPERVPSALESEWQAWMGSPKASNHPIGEPTHGGPVATLRAFAFGLYFLGSCLAIHGAQLLGAPLYFVSKDWFYAWMAMTKQYFGLLVTTMTMWWSPTTIRVSGDKSMKGLIKQDEDGMLRMEFGERIVLMANHQLYTDWLYMWWICYTNSPPMHGHIYIILKESLKYAPLLGPAMMFYGFIFMARKWAKDQERMRYRLRKLSTRHSGPMSGSQGEGQLDPMWLLIFPEGTNVSANTRHSSRKFCEKIGIPDMRHQLLPRSTGLQFCLQELNGTVEYLYDCTIGYEGIPKGLYGQDVFTLRSVYFQGRPPKSVNMHWRRFKVADLPLDDHDKMYEWTMQRWREKDDLLETFYQTGKFPAEPDAVYIEGAPQEKEWKTPYINTEVKPRFWGESLQMYVPVAGAALIGRILVRILDLVLGK